MYEKRLFMLKESSHAKKTQEKQLPWYFKYTYFYCVVFHLIRLQLFNPPVSQKMAQRGTHIKIRQREEEAQKLVSKRLGFNFLIISTPFQAPIPSHVCRGQIKYAYRYVGSYMTYISSQTQNWIEFAQNIKFPARSWTANGEPPLKVFAPISIPEFCCHVCWLPDCLPSLLKDKHSQ